MDDIFPLREGKQGNLDTRVLKRLSEDSDKCEFSKLYLRTVTKHIVKATCHL